MNTNYKLLNALDEEIEKSIHKFEDAKTGSEVRTFICTYERLMLWRSQEFTRIVVEELRMGEEAGTVTNKKKEFANNQNSIETVPVTKSISRHKQLILPLCALVISIAALVFSVLSQL